MIGNSNEPGVTATVDSAPSVTSSAPSPGDPVVIAAADLASGDASAGEVYSVSDSVKSQRLFGKESALHQQVEYALYHGAQPVLAVAPGTSDKSEDLSGIGTTTYSLSGVPTEDVEEFSCTIDSNEKTVKVVYKPVDMVSVASGEVAVNPVTGEVALDSAPSSSGTFGYTSLDHSVAFNAVAAYDGNIDFVAPRKETPEVVSAAAGTVNQMAAEETLAMLVAGVPPYMDPASFTNSFDDSRVQLLAGTRTESGKSAIGAYAGERAQLGLTSTPINSRLNLGERLVRRLDETQRGNFISKNVVPLERVGASARVADDINTVSDDNAQEANIRYGFTRLVVDYLIETTMNIESSFVGRFNSPGVVGQLQDLLDKEARPLNDSDVIYSNDVTVEMVDPTTARVVVRADVAEPIRFIENDFLIGNDLTLQNADE